jgi:hypothetical protein
LILLLNWNYLNLSNYDDAAMVYCSNGSKKRNSKKLCVSLLSHLFLHTKFRKPGHLEA